MDLLFILDPLETLTVYKDSSIAMMFEAAARGHAIHACGPQDLRAEGGRVLVRARPLALVGDGTAAPWHEAGLEQVRDLASFAAVLNRKDPPFDAEYLYLTHLLEHGRRTGARVFNDPRAVREHNEKLAILEFPQFTAPTIVTRDAARLRAFVGEQGEAVFKLLDGMGGASIFRARSDDPNLSVIIETMNQFGARTVMAQRYLPEIADGDKRVLLIGGKVVPFCLARIPRAGEARGNLAAGGTGVARPLTARDLEIAGSLAPQLQARGLLLVGLDVIGSCLTEINVTSPTCFREIMAQTGCDVAGLFIDALEAQLA